MRPGPGKRWGEPLRGPGSIPCRECWGSGGRLPRSDLHIGSAGTVGCPLPVP